MITLLFHLDERSKKVILVICALFIIILLIFGAIYALISKYMKKESKKMDYYMYDLLKFGIVKKPSSFKKAMQYHERRILFNQSKWFWRITILATCVALLLTFICFEQNYSGFFKEAFNLIPNFKWATIGSTNEALKEVEGATLLVGPSWLPVSVLPSVISKNPDFHNPMLYASMIYYILIIISFFGLLRAILGCIARTNRGNKMSKQVFEKTLDKLDVNNLNNINLNQTQQAQQTNNLGE